MAKKRTYNVDEVAILGRAHVENLNGKTHGDHVVLLVEGPLDQFVDVSRKTSGLAIVGKVTLGEAIVLTGEEGEDAKARLEDQRRIRTDDVHEGQGRIELPREKYERMSGKDLEAELVARELPKSGSKADKVQRLLDDDEAQEG